MLPSFCRDEITRVRPGLTTSRGSTIPDWSSDKVSKLVIKGCSVQPAATSMSQDGRVLAISDGYTAYIPEGSDVKAGDHIEWNGETYEINGEPRPWTGAQQCSHIQLALIRWEG